MFLVWSQTDQTIGKPIPPPHFPLFLRKAFRRENENTPQIQVGAQTLIPAADTDRSESSEVLPSNTFSL